MVRKKGSSAAILENPAAHHLDDYVKQVIDWTPNYEWSQYFILNLCQRGVIRATENPSFAWPLASRLEKITCKWQIQCILAGCIHCNKPKCRR